MYKDPDSECFLTKGNICFQLLKLQCQSGSKTETHGRSIVTLRVLWELVLAHLNTQKHTHSHSHAQRTCRGVSLLVSLQVGRRELLLARKVLTFAKPRGTVSIVLWALFSRYNHSSGLWKHCLNPNGDMTSPTFWLTNSTALFYVPREHEPLGTWRKRLLWFLQFA